MSWDGSRPSPRNTSLPPDWAARRRAVLQRDGHTCQLRLPGCIVTATIVDHVVSMGDVSGRGSHELTNLQAACQPCHKVKTRQETTAARWRYRAKRDPEPHPGIRRPTP